MDTSDKTPSEAQSNSTVQSNVRKKEDKTWDYTSLQQDETGKDVRICKFCDKMFRGRGIRRVKKHLSGRKGDTKLCPNVPADVRFTMEGLLKEIQPKAKAKAAGKIHVLDDDGDDEEEEEPQFKGKGKRKATSSYHPFFTKGKTNTSQPSIKKAMQSKERLHDVDLAIVMWFYDACIPLNACNSLYFPHVVDKITSIGYGYKPPTYHALRTNLLVDAKTSVSLLIDSYRSSWIECGCTIMSDGWRDIRQRHLINFLVYCPKWISFLKSVDASGIASDSDNLCNLFAGIVDMVGAKNVVQLITDNVANYKLAGNKLCERYPTITWSPCAAHCINLILQDMSKLENVDSLATLASRVIVFIYNHKWPLNWLRQRPGWKKIIRPGATRFATTFIALESLVGHNDDLQAMVVSNEYKKMLKVKNAVEVKSIILNDNFWRNSLIAVKVMTPLLKLLHLCDSDKKPALCYVYDGMYRAKKGIKELFNKKKELYKSYIDIINSRCDKMLRKSIHCAAYWLNPTFQYDSDNRCKKNEVFDGVLDMVEKYYSGQEVFDLTMALGKFRDSEGTFGRSSAIASRYVTRPDEWWKLFGGDYPKLQNFAIRILSQTAPSSGCERNWSVFERIHTKRRNRLEHQRLNDPVYVHYNLRLQNRLKVDARSYDLIYYQCIDEDMEKWVVEELPEGELDYDELEDMFNEQEQEPASQTQGYGLVDEDEDGSEFRLLSDRELDAYNTPMF